MIEGCHAAISGPLADVLKNFISSGGAEMGRLRAACRALVLTALLNHCIPALTFAPWLSDCTGGAR